MKALTANPKHMALDLEKKENNIQDEVVLC